MRILLLLFISIFISTPAFAWKKWKATIVNISDGDTITVIANDMQRIKIRLYGIDCPEKRQDFGNRARQATDKYVKGKTVEIQTIDTDRYGRLVAVVYLSNGDSLNELLVNDGLAWVYTQYCREKSVCDPLRKLETAAKTAKRGLWIRKDAVPPWEWRKQRRRSGATSYLTSAASSALPVPSLFLSSARPQFPVLPCGTFE